MKLPTLRSIVLAAALLAGSSAALRAAEANKEDAAFATQLVTAIQESNYAAFVSPGDAPFKQMKKEQFDGLAAQLAPKLNTDHELIFLGELNQRGFRVTLWKIHFSDGSDDLQVTLSVKAGKVGGFFIR